MLFEASYASLIYFNLISSLYIIPCSRGDAAAIHISMSKTDPFTPIRAVATVTGFSHIDEGLVARVESTGVRIDRAYNPHVQYLIAHGIRRTIKFFVAINRGLHIFSSNDLDKWIKSNGTFPDPVRNSLLMNDPDGERVNDLSLRRSIMRARNRPVFKGKKVYVFPNSTTFTSEEIKLLIESGGGRIISRLPSVRHNISKIVIIADRANERHIKSAGYPGYYTESGLMRACMSQQLDGISGFCKV